MIPTAQFVVGFILGVPVGMLIILIIVWFILQVAIVKLQMETDHIQAKIDMLEGILDNQK